MRNLTYAVGLATAAEMLEVDRETVRRWVRSGLLDSARGPGGATAPYMVDRRDVAELARNRADRRSVQRLAGAR